MSVSREASTCFHPLAILQDHLIHNLFTQDASPFQHNESPNSIAQKHLRLDRLGPPSLDTICQKSLLYRPGIVNRRSRITPYSPSCIYGISVLGLAPFGIINSYASSADKKRKQRIRRPAILFSRSYGRGQNLSPAERGCACCASYTLWGNKN